MVESNIVIVIIYINKENSISKIKKQSEGGGNWVASTNLIFRAANIKSPYPNPTITNSIKAQSFKGCVQNSIYVFL